MKQLFLIPIFFLFSIALNSTTYYVKEGGSGNLNGLSWANASDDLQAMINLSQSGDAVFVAKGTYYPNKASNHLAGTVNPHNRNNAFFLKKDVKIYGSFPADANDNDHKTIDDRFPNEWTLNTTLLGDLKQNTNWDDFAYHVVISAGDVGNALLDGFIIANGHSNGESKDKITVNGYEVNNAMGAGMYNVSSSPTLIRIIFVNNAGKFGGGIFNSESSPVIENCSIYQNYVTEVGGGIYNFKSSPTLTHVDIFDNNANRGGGMHNYSGSSPQLANVSFINNEAGYGGGLYNDSKSAPSFFNVTIKGNTASKGSGGGISNNEANPTFLNTLICENISAMGGGGIYNNNSSPVLINTTLSGNVAGNGYALGGGIKNYYYSEPRYRNCIIWGNAGTDNINNELNSRSYYSYCLIEGATNETGGNLNGDTNNPLFVGNGDYSLHPTSPCIDKGSNSIYEEAGGYLNSDVDLAGNPRLLGISIDMGAYEIDGSGSSITELTIPAMEVIGSEGKIVIKSVVGTQINIYTIDGKLIFDGIISNDPEIIPIQRGIYIVLSNGKSQKVYVR